MPHDLSAEAIEIAVHGRLGRPVRFFDAIGSTNDEAWGWARDGAPEGAMVVADHQTQGRGRWDRDWIDRPGSSLMFSLILRPQPDAEAVRLLTTAAGVACSEAVEAVYGVRTGLKWPNDVTVGGRKLAGLLVESATRGDRVEVAVVGFGLNMHLPAGMPAEVVDGATSISDALGRSEPGRPVDRAGLLAAILTEFEHTYGRLTDPAGRAELLRRAERRSVVIGMSVAARLADGRTLSGIARGLLPSGALEIEVKGARLALHSAEITQLRAAPVPRPR
ncbi:MAG: biotin--[acetyl-CoA-carboxylase] ligase [Actinobacteria bacterium]|nr:biotin--[acetyl-CoA-carboxylase] ligase [Actinomycetota bacterium]